MASLSNDRGLRRILVCLPDGSRSAIRLGRIPIKDARTIKGHIEQLVSAKWGGFAIAPTTVAWLPTIGDTLRDRLVTLGLAEPKAAPVVATLGTLVDQYKARPKWSALSEKTRDNYVAGFTRLLRRLGAATRVDAVTTNDAEDFRGWMLEAKPAGCGLARATANQDCRTSSMLFRYAVRARLIAHNPFDGIEQSSVATKRKAFVPAETAYLLIDAMKDSEWRLLVALARWGGLRVPSEPRLLRWGDIDRERNRILINSPKTAHHEGHEQRTIPLFPELEEFIQQRYDDAEPGEQFVLPMMRRLGRSAFNSHVRYTLGRLGLDKWPRAFHSLRSTRQTELEETYPSHVVCAWLGNSVTVAQKHYLQVTEAHFAEAAQKAAQSVSARPRTAMPKRWTRKADRPDLRGLAEGVVAVRTSE